MSYEPKVWENGSATGVVPDAGDLNRLEEGLAAVAQQVDSVDTEASSTVGLLALMPATGTGSKALYYATDAGTYADFTNGGAYTKVADLPGTGGVQLARISVGTLVNITSTSVVALPSPGPAATGNVNIPAGTQAVKVRAEIPNVGATTANTVVTLELFVDGVAVRGAVRNIVATGDVFDGSMDYQQNAPSAGNHTYEVRAAVSGNTGKLNTFPVGDSVVLTVTTVKTS